MIMINKYSFEGHYAELCRQFIEYKQGLGYKYGARSIRAVRQMNEYLHTHIKEKATDDYSLDKDVVLIYTAKREGESPQTHQMRESVTRQFAIFLSSLGITAHILPLRKKEKGTFTPYIFTKQQICAILDIADNLEYEYRSPNYHFVYPFLIRLLYCCGLRISEALSLKLSDIDFDERVLKIKQAKYNNSRLVPISDSLFAALEKYMEQVGYLKTDKDLLFRTRWDKPYNSGTILGRFKVFLEKANILFTENGRLPRIHDIRHTFAIHSLDFMVSQGIDTYLAIPYLAAYMGHRKIKCTEQYLRLTAESYDSIIESLTPVYADLFPKGGEAE